MSATYRAMCDCGWARSYRSEGIAEYALRQHSCQRQRDLDARLARGAQTRATIDRTPKPCWHKRVRHQHGTNACYTLDRCKCAPCAAAHSEATRRRSRLQAYGRYDRYAPAGPVRAHVRRLVRAGIGLKRIGAVSGVGNSTLGKLINGQHGRPPSQRVLRSTAQRLLSVSVSDLAGGALVDQTGTARRLQALVAIGWSAAELGRRLDRLPSNMTALVHGRGQVTVRTRACVAELYDQLSTTVRAGADHRTRQSISRSRAAAARNGWAPPLAWDDDRIEDPAAAPEGVEWQLETGRAGTRLVSELAEDVEFLLDGGLSSDEVSARLGMQVASVETALHRAGLSDLAHRFQCNSSRRAGAA